MSNRSTPLDYVSESQRGKATTVDALVDALSPGSIYGRRASGCIGLTWAYYGGKFPISGAPTPIANNTVTLTDNATNYLRVDVTTGVLSAVTSAPSGWPGPVTGYLALYEVVAASSQVADWTDWRCLALGTSSGGAPSGAAGGDLTGTYPNPTIASSAVTTAKININADLPANSHKITGLTDPSSAQDAATKAYVDAQSQGLDPKASVKIATTANITLSGEQTIDGVLTSSSRVLVKNQSTGSQNGIYVSNSSTWVRATDADTSAKVTAGLYVFATEGTGNADTGWVLTTNDPITLGSTSLAFAQFTAGGATGAAGGDLTGTYPNPTLASKPYDVGGGYPGAPTGSVVLLRYPFPRTIVFPSGLTNSQGVAATASTGTATFDIKKNGTNVGTMVFTSSGVATFTMGSQTTFSAGDIMTVVAPASPDATLADIGFSLAGTR